MTGGCLAAGGAALLLAGCSTTATLHRSGGPNLESKIVYGDETAVFVQSDNGLVYRVERRSIVDIDHPGNVNMTIGALCLAGAGFGFGLAMSGSVPEERDDNLAIAAIYSAIGLPLLISGAYLWLRSTRAERGHGNRPALVYATPPDVPLVPPTWPPPKSRLPAPAVAAPAVPPAAVPPAAAVTPASAVTPPPPVPPPPADPAAPVD